MKWSQYFFPTLREDPKDAEAISHKLMVRAGLVRRLGAGAYSYLPYGYRALKRVMGIIREEMDRAGAHELLLPALQPAELWKETGRDAVLGEVLIRFKDRSGRDLVLGPTHEEVVTDLMRDLKSYKQLPFCVYQIQTKFRDEPRPRFGVIRSKEFLMKDAYSFHLDAKGLEEYYRVMVATYERIFSRCGLRFSACIGDSGAMGGDVSHEFLAPSEYGEGMIVRCSRCGYAATLEAVAFGQETGGTPEGGSPGQAMELKSTPDKHTVEQVSAFLGVPASTLIKTLIYEVDDEPLAVLIAGNHELNEAKLARLLNGAPFRMADKERIQKVTGGPVGFSGPVGLKGLRVVADHAVKRIAHAVVGANKPDAHYIHARLDRDFAVSEWADLRLPVEGDPCPACTDKVQAGKLAMEQAIEIGHVFKLGTKYTEALNILVQHPEGGTVPLIMGCYGIGVNRLLATVIEQRHDAKGIVWPPAIAPFQVLITLMEYNNEEQIEAGTRVNEALSRSWDVLLDDRDHSPGSKLKDAELIGVPVHIIVGKAWKQEGRLELRCRRSGEKQLLKPEEVGEAVQKLLDKDMRV